MQYLSLITTIFIIMGCSNKNSYLNSKDSQYQRFLNYQSDKKLNSEIDNYEEK